MFTSLYKMPAALNMLCGVCEPDPNHPDARYYWYWSTRSSSRKRADGSLVTSDSYYDDDFEIRILIMLHLFLIVLDVPCSIMALIVFVTLWRAKPLFIDLRDSASSSRKREHCVRHFGLLMRDILYLFIFDIPCFFMGVFVLCTLWRASTLYKFIHYEANNQYDRRLACLTQFGLFWRDLLFVIPFALMVCDII